MTPPAPGRAVSGPPALSNRTGRPASADGCRKAVSDRFISAATRCIQAGSAPASSRQTAAGLPANGSSVKASTW
jgi:hypothetical protein